MKSNRLDITYSQYKKNRKFSNAESSATSGRGTILEVNSAEYTETTPGNTITPGSKILKNVTYNSEIRNLTYNSEVKHTGTTSSDPRTKSGDAVTNPK